MRYPTTTTLMAFATLMACDSEPQYTCVASGTADCPMETCCPEQTTDVADCYIATPRNDYQCPDNGDAQCSQAICRAISECFGEETMAYMPDC